MSEFKIGVIGTINKDSVTLPDGRRYRGWGGILYNLVVLSDKLKKHADIFPVCNIGRNCHAPIMKILKRLPSVKSDFIRRVPERNNHCHLTYLDSEAKSEILEGGVPPLRFDDVMGLLNCDAVLLNFISGRDVDLRSMGKFRRLFKGIIYTDIHSYTLGKKADGRRFLRVPPHWTTVVKYSDLIQMNRRELQLLCGDRPGNDMTAKQNLRRLKSRLKAAKVDINRKKILVTDGARGCYLYNPHRDRPELTFFDTEREGVRGDTTGCGDCFGAAFLADFIMNSDISHAIKAGHRAARHRILGAYPVSFRP